jgi:molecular chaperone GrpE
MEFDPHFHESVLQIPTNDAPEETIMEVFKSGYTFNSKVIRPAMVTISSPVEDE